MSTTRQQSEDVYEYFELKPTKQITCQRPGAKNDPQAVFWMHKKVPLLRENLALAEKAKEAKCWKKYN